jgi:hypothetical protein
MTELINMSTRWTGVPYAGARRRRNMAAPLTKPAEGLRLATQSSLGGPFGSAGSARAPRWRAAAKWGLRAGPARGRRPVAAARSHAGMGQGYWITGGGGSVAGCRSRPVHAPDPAKLLASRLSASDRGRGFACRVPPLSRGASGLPYQSPVAGRGRVARRLASRVVRPSRRRIASVS